MHDWPALEAAYLATPHGDLRRFSGEVGVPVRTIEERSHRGGWRAKWAEVQAQALERAQAATVVSRSEQIAAANDAHFAAAELVLGGIRAYTDGIRKGNDGQLLLLPDEALKIATALSKLQAVQRIALGVPGEKQAVEVTGPSGGPVPISTLTIHVVQARESPEPPDERDDAAA